MLTLSIIGLIAAYAHWLDTLRTTQWYSCQKYIIWIWSWVNIKPTQMTGHSTKSQTINVGQREISIFRLKETKETWLLNEAHELVLSFIIV